MGGGVKGEGRVRAGVNCGQGGARMQPKSPPPAAQRTPLAPRSTPKTQLPPPPSPQGRDCYMFQVSDDCVIDNTTMGSPGRFTNHSCAPCMYSRVIELGGKLHLCFFARTDIKAGQELT